MIESIVYEYMYLLLLLKVQVYFFPIGEGKEGDAAYINKAFYYLCLLQYIIISYNMIFICLKPKT